jgi:gluconate 2-dehydrogenase gamma chain
MSSLFGALLDWAPKHTVVSSQAFEAGRHPMDTTRNAEPACVSQSAITRRTLLASTAAFFFSSADLGFALTVTQGLPWTAGSARPPALVRPGPWMFFTADEAATVEAIVDRLVPADELGPGGKVAGCAVFIDRQLAGPYGRSEGFYLKPPFMPGTPSQGYQSPEAPAARYRGALAALRSYVAAAYGNRSFQELSPAQQDEILAGVESGAIAFKEVNGPRFFDLLLQNTMEGFFADPIYGGNRDMAGWKLVGFPGARYDYRDWVERHNERYPLPPVGIMGRPEWNTGR